MPEIIARARLKNFLIGTFDIKRVLVFVKIDGSEGTEIDGIGAGDKSAVVVIRIKHLHGKRFPTAGRSAIQETRPALPDSAELFFDIGDEFRFDGIAVGTEVRRINSVGIVVIRICVLDFYNQDPGEAGANPLFVKFVGFFLLYAVVTSDVKTLAVIGFQILVGRLGTKASKISREVAF